MNGDGSNQTRLTTTKAHFFDGYPAWSPDGSRIAFIRGSAYNSNDDIMVMNADGTGEANITNSAEPEGAPGWQSVGPGQGPDADADGCSNKAESGPDPTRGGLRSSALFWDFFDTPDASNARDKQVSGLDFFRILARFGATGDQMINPLSAPSSPPAYHTAFDRGEPYGLYPWNLTPANGSIGGTDFFAALAQFGHSCA